MICLESQRGTADVSCVRADPRASARTRGPRTPRGQLNSAPRTRLLKTSLRSPPFGWALRLGLVEIFKVFFLVFFFGESFKIFFVHFFFYHFEKFYIKGYNSTIASGVDELKIKFKHSLGCGAFFCQIGRKQCTFQKWFYNWS